jgi:hypothetical protein
VTGIGIQAGGLASERLISTPAALKEPIIHGVMAWRCDFANFKARIPVFSRWAVTCSLNGIGYYPKDGKCQAG